MGGPRRSLTRRAVLAAAAAGALGVAGCSWSPVRLDTAGPVPRRPPASPSEVARSQVAAGARTAVQVLSSVDQSLLPGVTASRLPGWIDVHRRHRELLRDADVSDVFPAPGGDDGAQLPPELRRDDGAAGVAGLLRALGGVAARAAATAPDVGVVHVRIAAARWVQGRQLAADAGLTGPDVRWPPGAPVSLVQDVLAAHHAAIDGYTTAAAWARSQRDGLVRDLRTHEAAREELSSLVAATGAVPVAPAPGYALPAEVRPGGSADGDPDGRAATLALTIETGLARAVASAVATVLASGSLGADGAAALAAAGWTIAGAEDRRQRGGGEPDPLPGS